MAAWLPVVKAAIPHIANIVTVALPIFTSKSGNSERDALTARQIGELQGAATQNAESVRELAAQVKTTFEGLETAAAGVERQLRAQKVISILAVSLSMISLIICSLLLTRG